MKEVSVPINARHCFIDEAGDTTFYGKGKIPIIGTEGVSSFFLIGLLTITDPITDVRQKVEGLQQNIINDPYFKSIPSILKKKGRQGYFLHAKDDIPEVRKMCFDLIKTINCSITVVTGKKDYGIYERKHNGNQSEFYADLFSHLLTDQLNEQEKLILNIAHRSKCTTHRNLEKGIQKAIAIAKNKYPESCNCCTTVCNVQQPTTEPIINVVDYMLWAIQRKLEKGESRYADYIDSHIKSISILYNDGEG